VILVEDQGRVLIDDNPFDLHNRSLRFIPRGDGFEITEEPLSYDPELGALVIDDFRSFTSYRHSLSAFSFPFGGHDYTDL
jgi:hypothetical protein